MSVTNFSEKLATGVPSGPRRTYGLDIDNTIWLEHYPATQLRKHMPLTKKEYDLITYHCDLHTLTTSNPSWHRLAPAHVAALLDQPSLSI